MIRRIGHTALCVSDMDRSLAFYKGLFGMEEVLEVDLRDERMKRLLGDERAECRVVHLSVGGTVLELFQYYSPEDGQKRVGHRQFDAGFTHIGFEVTEMDRHLDDLRRRGVQLVGEPVTVRRGCRVVYFYGPDGEVLELRETQQEQ